MKKLFLLLLFGINSILWGATSVGAQVVHFVATLTDGQKISFTQPTRVAPVLPLRLPDESGEDFDKYTEKDITSVELAKGEEAIDGCSRWEVKRVATPSLLQGLKHTELRLVGVAKENGKATVYRWTVALSENGETIKNRVTLWYGVEPKGAEMVYPFIQDNKVWLRDIKIVLGKTNADFVDAVQNYYVKTKRAEATKRQADLKQNPVTILEHAN